MNTEFTIKHAEEKDLPHILSLIKEIADFENLSHEVTATEEILREQLFEKKHAEVILALLNKEIIGYALYFHNFSTFLGKAGLYLEDIYIKEKFRGRGFGKKLFRYLAALSIKRGCGRMEWCVLNWNRKAIDFYEAAGARAMSEWTTYRLSGDSLKKLQDNDQG